MRIPVPLIIDIPDDRLPGYAAEYGLEVRADGQPMARTVVEHVRGKVLGNLQMTVLGEYADITIKGR